MRGSSKLAIIAVIGAAGMCVGLPVQAASSTWSHGGSRVTLEENGTKRIITFAEPKAGLDKAGVKRGTVLFEGEVKKDGRLSGYAKIYKAGCEPVDYFVEGTLDSRKGEIVLQGQAPVYSGSDCKIKGYSEDNASSTLVFNATGDRGGGTYANRGNFDQGDGAYASGAPREPRYDGRNDNRGTAPGYGQRDESDQQYGGSGGANDERSGDGRQDGGYGSRDYAERGSGREDYDPRSGRPRDDGYVNEPSDDMDDDVEEYRTYRYRTYTAPRPYQPWWRRGY